MPVLGLGPGGPWKRNGRFRQDYRQEYGADLTTLRDREEDVKFAGERGLRARGGVRRRLLRPTSGLPPSAGGIL